MWLGTKSTVLELVENESFEEAEKLCRKACAEITKLRGEFHSEAIDAQILIGRILRLQSKLPESLRILIEGRKKLDLGLTKWHPLAAILYQELGELYEAEAKDLEAFEFYRLAEEVVDCGIEQDKLALANLLAKKAGTLRRLGWDGDAEECYTKTANLFNALTDDDSNKIQVAQALAQIGFLHQDHSRFEEAVKALKEAKQTVEKTISKNVAIDSSKQQRLYIEILVRLGKSLTCIDKNDEAVDNLILAIQEQSLLYGERSPQVVALFEPLLRATSKRGDIEEIEHRYKVSLEITKEVLGDKSPKVGKLLQAMGEHYCLEQNFTKAREMLDGALAIFSNANSEDHPTIADILHNIGTVSLVEGNLEESHTFLTRALKSREKNFGNQHVEVARSLMALSVLEKKVGNPHRAEQHIERVKQMADSVLKEDEFLLALAIKEERQETTIYQVEDIDIQPEKITSEKSGLAQVGSMYSAALMEMDQKNFEKATEILIDTLRILEADRGENHQDLVPILESMSHAYKELGKEEDSNKAKERALSISA